MSRVIMVSYYFPPLAGIASERAVGFARHLPGMGWEPVVVAPVRGHFHQHSGNQPPTGVRVIRTSNPETSRMLRRVYSSGAGLETPSEDTVTPIKAGSAGSRIRGLAREFLYIPDAQVAWIPFAFRAAAGALREHGARPSVVHSSSVPFSAHLAAGWAARQAGVPWVAEFRDPWSAQDPSRLPRSAFRRELDRRIEGWILRAADHVVVTAQRTRELLLEGFGGVREDKVSVIPNGFEPLPLGSVPEPHEPLTLVHAGTVHDEEYLRPLVEALLRIQLQAPASFRVICYGESGPWLDLLSDMEVDFPEWLDLRGVVDPHQAQEAIRDASALLLAAPHPRFRLILLGKLLTYLGARRPVFGIVPEGSEMDQLIRDATEGWVVRPWTTERIGEAFLALLDAHRSGQIQSPRVGEELVRPYTREAQASKLARVFDSVAEKGRRA